MSNSSIKILFLVILTGCTGVPNGPSTGTALDETAHSPEISVEQKTKETFHRRVSADKSHVCFIESSGGVACLGLEYRGRSQNCVARQISDLNNAVEIASGHDYACARTADGQVSCWGDSFVAYPSAYRAWEAENRRQGVGVLMSFGTQPFSLIPKAVPGLNDVTKIVAGPAAACALNTSRKLACWGHSRGYLGHKNLLRPRWVPEYFGINDVALGENHVCSVHNEKLLCGGSRRSRQIPRHQYTDVSSVLARGNNTCFQLETGSDPPRLVCVGQMYNDLEIDQRGIYLNPAVFPLPPTISDLEMGFEGELCGLGSLGDIFCVCRGEENWAEGNCGVPPLRGVKSFALGEGFGCALMNDEQFRCWGEVPGCDQKSRDTVSGSTFTIPVMPPDPPPPARRKQRKVFSVNIESCEAKGGLDSASVRRILIRYRYHLRGCYEAAYKADPSLSGMIKGQVFVKENGSPVNVHFSGIASENKSLNKCFVDRHQKMIFPSSSKNSIIRLEYRLKVRDFQPFRSY